MSIKSYVNMWVIKDHERPISAWCELGHSALQAERIRRIHILLSQSDLLKSLPRQDGVF
jgi:hypothetical protein